MMTPVPSAEALLAHARWVETFARALVAEDSDDVAQDAWMAAIQHGVVSRPWFATVMRNAVRMRWRSTTRRQLREQATDSAATRTPEELAQRMELQTKLASAVLALEEPQRSTIILVFYEGLSPAEIARQQAIPATTVRSRLRAALVTLRRELELEGDGWKLALAPLVAVPSPPIALPFLAIALALLAVVTAIAVIARVAPSASTSPPPPPVTHASFAVPPRPALPEIDAPPTYEVEVLPERSADDPPPEPGTPAARMEQMAKIMQIGMKRVDECYDLALAAGREVSGEVNINIQVVTWPDVIAQVKINDGTTVTDPETLECIRENPAAIEEPMERYLDEDDELAGLTTFDFTISQTLPRTP
jgi:RNA polymerase sigma factor (sigma-70 family)